MIGVYYFTIRQTFITAVNVGENCKTKNNRKKLREIKVIFNLQPRQARYLLLKYYTDCRGV